MNLKYHVTCTVDKFLFESWVSSLAAAKREKEVMQREHPAGVIAIKKVEP